MSILLVALVVCVLQVPVTLCLPNGAPVLCCNTLTPLHGVDPLLGTSNFTYSITKDEDTNRFTVNIVKTSADGAPFRGFVMQARDQATNAKVGTFIDPETGTKLLNCDAVGDSITHTDNSDKDTLQLHWVPPPGPLTGIRFSMSPVQTAAQFWVGVLSEDLGGF